MTTEPPKYLSVFTPSQTNPEDLEAIFVQRQDYLKDAIERIKESATTGNKHHQLIVGQRGSGKTNLVTLLVYRLEQDQTLKEQLQIAWLNEDETSVKFLDILLRIYQALNKRYPKYYPQNTLEEAYEKTEKQAQDYLATSIASSLNQNKKTLLIIIENLDAVFESIGDQGQKQLRAYIQENPHFSIFATAQKLIDNLTNRKDPFFGFFQTEHLQPLNEQEATQLISNIADLQHKPKVTAFLKTPKGQARIKALHHLSGGNHRMYIVLSQFINQDSIDALVPPFLKMVDELTPYYQERLRWLPPQQRKIIEQLSNSRTTMTVTQLAKRLFASNQTTSKQLQELRNKGYVQSHKDGRESHYEISEPLMRICTEVKENQRNEPLAILIDFIRAWYDSQDLNERLKNKAISTTAKYYLEAALEKSMSLERKINKQLTLTDKSLAKTLNSYDTKQSEVEAFDEKIADLTQVIELKDAPVEQVAIALLYRGVSYGQLGETDKEIADYTQVIELKDAPVEQVAIALVGRGIGFFGKKEYVLASQDLRAIILNYTSHYEQVQLAYMCLAELELIQMHWTEALQCITEGLKVMLDDNDSSRYNSQDIIGALFTTTQATQERTERITEMLQIYKNHEQALASLGSGLVEHLGSLFQADELPFKDNLESWLVAWQAASKDIEGLSVAMRIFEVGVEFLKSKGKHEGVLYTLVETERSILRQALGLDEAS